MWGYVEQENKYNNRRTCGILSYVLRYNRILEYCIPVRQPIGQLLRDGYEALRSRAPVTVRAVLDRVFEEMEEVDYCLATLRGMEDCIRAIFDGLDDRTRCFLVALAKLADSDLMIAYRPMPRLMLAPELQWGRALMDAEMGFCWRLA